MISPKSRLVLFYLDYADYTETVDAALNVH